MMENYFAGVKDLFELKNKYRELAKKFHPDLGGNGEIMKVINDQHDKLFEVLKAQHNARAEADESGKTKKTTETAEEYRDVIVKLLRIADITIELCGNWLWVTGDTKAHKDELKAAGLKWSNNKKAWYWRHPEDRGRYWGVSDMSYIRKTYGSVKIVGNDEALIA